MRLSRLFCKITAIIFSLVFIVGINPVLSSASVKIDAGKLLDVIIDEVKKDGAKKETPEAIPPQTGQSGGTLSEEEYEERSRFYY